MNWKTKEKFNFLLEMIIIVIIPDHQQGKEQEWQLKKDKLITTVTIMIYFKVSIY